MFLREWTPERTSVDGVLAAPVRPVCDFIVPPGLPADGKRNLVSRVSSAVVRACDPRAEVASLPSGKQESTRWVLSFFREAPLEQAALDDLMAFENPMVIESLEGSTESRGAALKAISYQFFLCGIRSCSNTAPIVCSAKVSPNPEISYAKNH